MGFSTPAGKDLATSVWCILDAAGFNGLDEEDTPRGGSESGYRMLGHGDKVEVFYEAADEVFADTWTADAQDPGHRAHHRWLFRRQLETVMLGAITQTLLADGFGFTHQPSTAQRPAVLLVHSRPARGIF